MVRLAQITVFVATAMVLAKWTPVESTCATTKLSFASYYTDSMVLQSEPTRAVIWGYVDGASEGQQVIISVYPAWASEATAAGKHYKAIIAPGKSRRQWNVTLDVMPAGGPYTIQASVQDVVISLTDVLFGDVWICSGQSNMQYFLQDAFEGQTEIDNSPWHPNIRMYRVRQQMSYTPKTDVANSVGTWKKPNAGDIKTFSAVCWMFGRRLSAFLTKPIGLIESCWGSTIIETWSSPDVIRKCPSAMSLTGKNTDSALWNGMIHPLLPLSIKGVIWYQGEGNMRHFEKYNCTFPAMINDWREKFHIASGGQTDPKFPFGFVQLSAYRTHPGYNVRWPGLRWAQTAGRGYVPNDIMQNVFMAVAMDLPDFDSPRGGIHPRHKQEIGRRLALSALGVAYGKDVNGWHGPRPTHFNKTSSSEIEITFNHGSATIDFRNGNAFQVCCSPIGVNVCNGTIGTYWPNATAKLKGTSIVVVSAHCYRLQRIQGVRYAWTESPCPLKQCSLYSSEEENSLPAPPFIYKGGFI